MYYWAVLPAAATDGSDALPLDLPNSAKGSFQKQSTPPTLVSPLSVQTFLDQPRRLAGVRVRVTGAGIRAVARRTKATGMAKFTVRPRKRGKLLVSATKSDFQPAYGTLRVR